MKKNSKKGFTLIELLAVITIMGILLLVSIPAVSRTIENSRRNTFVNTARAYIDAVKKAVVADEIGLYSGTDRISVVPAGFYFFPINTDKATAGDWYSGDLMEQGGKSPWGNNNLQGYVAIRKTSENNIAKYEYGIFLQDEVQKRGTGVLLREKDVVRSKIGLVGQGALYRAHPSGWESSDNFIADDGVTYHLQNSAAEGKTLCTRLKLYF